MFLTPRASATPVNPLAATIPVALLVYVALSRDILGSLLERRH
jgi:hypothetical protein